MRHLLLCLSLLLSPTLYAAKPNIVFILMDDMGIGDVSVYNAESKIITPHMDALAEGGILFTDAHSNSSVCTPTRYGVLTGRYCWRTRLAHGVTWGTSRSLIKKDRITIASFLKEQGYNTAVVGKWHLGLDFTRENKTILWDKPITLGPTHLGFDYFFGMPASLDIPPYIYIENDKILEAPTANYKAKHGQVMIRGGKCFPGFDEKNVLPDFTKKAVAFIEQQSKETPFFLYVPYASPHTPVAPNDAFLGKSEAGIYGDFVIESDWGVGEIVAALKRKEVFDNTLVIVTSDNGSSSAGYPIQEEIKHKHNTSLGYKGRKSHTYEGGHRVPFIAHWPKGIAKPGKSDAIICTTDLFATAADMINTEIPAAAAGDSVSFLPALKGKTEGLRNSVVHHSLDGTFCLRRDNWKIIFGRGQGGFKQIKEPVSKDWIQLYDLEKDRGETTNVAADHPEVVDSLRTAMAEIVADGRSTEGAPQTNDRKISFEKKPRQKK